MIRKTNTKREKNEGVWKRSGNDMEGGDAKETGGEVVMIELPCNVLTTVK